MTPFDPEPRELCPDPQLGTREGWNWCDECQAIKEPGHTHASEETIKIAEVLFEHLIDNLHEATARAEYAESLLCALAFDHQRAEGCPWNECLFCVESFR